MKMKEAADSIAQFGTDSLTIRHALQRFMTAPLFTFDISYTNTQGVIEYVEPQQYNDSVVGKDWSSNPLFQEILQNKQPVLTKLDSAFEGGIAEFLLYPVVKNEEVLGILAAIFIPYDYLGGLFNPVMQDKDFILWSFEKGGTFLFDQISEIIGKNIFNDTLFAPYVDFVNAARLIDSLNTGKTTYNYIHPITQEPVNEKSYWNTFTFYGNEWKLIRSTVTTD